MAEIGEIYKDLLDRDFQSNPFPGNVKMFSSVLGRELDHATDAEYWKANMVSPVLFDHAVREMTSGREGVNFLIEIGPSGALAGPIAQIKKELSNGGSNIQYCTALSRGQEAIKSLFEVSGRLFISGGDIDLRMVNRYNSGSRPLIITDLPNYSWNHSTKYWYESEVSKDWHYRLFPHHDLLGTKVLGTSYYAPVWKKALLVDDLPWLKDHKVSNKTCPKNNSY
jgi:acyl transferase domain-containing protein